MQAHITGSDTVAAILLERAAAREDAPFLIFEDLDGSVRQRTYGETYARAARAANLLRGAGVGRGDSVNIHMWNCPEFYDCWFGTALLGAVMVPTNPLLTADELGYVLEHAECTFGVTQPKLLGTMEAARPASLKEIMVAGATEGGDDAADFERELSRQPGELSGSVPAGARDVAAVLYTSGTTSRPKGVLVTNANYLYAGEVVAQHLRMRRDDRMMIALPLFHANAQYYSTMSALVTGSSIVLAERFSASRWPGQVARHGATLASLFAAPIRMLLARLEDESVVGSRLRAVIFSQNLTPDQLEDFERRFGCRLLQLYGMTETIAPPTLDPLYGKRSGIGIGRPTLPARIRIVDDRGRDVAPGEVGELLVHGEPGVTLMAGYLADPDATAAAVTDGWLHTGDNVRMDAEGYFYFVDRARDMIKRAGENVSAGEIESVVNSHPAVFESAAIGVPDEVRDEAIKLFVVLHEEASASAEDILSLCARRLARFKVPGSIEFVDGLPRTSVGKIQKEELRRRERSSPARETRNLELGEER